MSHIEKSEPVSPMRFTSADTEQREGESILKLSAANGDTERPVCFRTRDAVLSLRNEAFVCLGLLPAMKTGQNMRIDGELSGRFRDSLETVQDIYCSWDPSFRRVEIVGATARAIPSRPGRGVGLFFTGGLDSFYTLLKHKDEITHLIFVHGIDFNLKDPILRSQVSKMLKNVSVYFDVQLIEIEANLRYYSDVLDLDWSLSHGGGFAATAYSLSPLIRRIYMPSSFTYAEMVPWGSHRVLDPLWSSEDLEFVHDGCEATRIQKAAYIATSEIAMASLRVCFHNTRDTHNCGRCEKCLRTMVNLYAAGALERCSTFPNKIDIRLIKRLSIFNEQERGRIRENLRALENRPEAHEIVRALKLVLNRPKWRGHLNQQFWRRLRVWKRSIRRRLGLEKRIPA
ncbi:MAG: hypothetical protein OEV08_03670 [Nitrospira sp.]|nr:hypothetical protein [Nitrospira sp.]